MESIKGSPAPQELVVTCSLNLEGCGASDWGAKTDLIRFLLCVFRVLMEREQPVREQPGLCWQKASYTQPEGVPPMSTARFVSS